MIKFIFILISIFTVGFFIVKDTWMVTLQGFGYELKASVLILIVGAFLLFYLIHLLKKPFGWWGRCQNWFAKRKQDQKEAFLLLALKTVLDKNSESVKQLLKQKNKFFDRKSDENYILEALFNPTPHTFEQLIHRENTELAGIKGLLDYAQEDGNWTEAGRLLQKAAEKYEKEPWVWDSLWTVQILQNDWYEALNTLERLKAQGQVDKAEYAKRKSLLLLKLGRVAEAYKLNPDNQAIILAYARSEPQKADKLIRHLWSKEPCMDAFNIYWQTIATEKPSKQTKAIDKLVRENPKHRLSLWVLIETAIKQESWGPAKGYLSDYLAMYPLTTQIAHLMAEVERQGWHHLEEAQKWELKALEAPSEKGWICSSCGHRTDTWEIVCPACNAFGEVIGK
ncbi:MAG: hypothetical protein IKS41_02955 [Alphaproteobacteria bacterium]|nr:hypothetical protein [Alphaproteobacteria bacterium]